MKKSGFLLYGANGYTGRLIAEVAISRGVRPVLAGRRREAIEPLAASLGLSSRCFPLDEARRVAAELEPFRALLLVAGPFSATSRVALEACLTARTAYLDITGEIDVFESVFARHGDAVAAGIPVLPGVGFDVVPSDCLAAALAAELPGAESLELAFRGFKTSAGTLKTMIEGLPKGGRARVDGRIVAVPAAWKTLEVPFPDKTRLAMSIPWGDVSTAYRSTGIPNITVYMAMPLSAIAAARRTRLVSPLLGVAPVQAFLKWRAGARQGPTAEERERERSVLWGRVRKGVREVTGTLETLEGYSLTAETAVEAAQRVMTGEMKAGAFTPSQAFGARFIETVRGSRLHVPA